MAKKVNKTDEQLANVEGNLSKAGLYVVKNSKKLIILVGAIILIFAIYIGYNKIVVDPNDYESKKKSIYLNSTRFPITSEIQYVAQIYAIYETTDSKLIRILESLEVRPKFLLLNFANLDSKNNINRSLAW